MTPIPRQEARERVARARVAQLSREQRATTLREWWSLDSEDEGWWSLPRDLQQQLRAQPEAPSDVMSSSYDPLLRLAMMEETVGVRNSWLRAQLESSDGPVMIVGEPEAMLECRCCEYHTIRERGHYEICPVCFWEDDGMQALDRMSGPNHMTLQQARDNLARIGACDEQALRHIDANARAMFRPGKSAKS
jgi:hypothetical protein